MAIENVSLDYEDGFSAVVSFDESNNAGGAGYAPLTTLGIQAGGAAALSVAGPLRQLLTSTFGHAAGPLAAAQNAGLVINVMPRFTVVATATFPTLPPIFQIVRDANNHIDIQVSVERGNAVGVVVYYAAHITLPTTGRI